MKSSFSVFLLFLRHSAWKVLLLVAAMAALQIGLFWGLTPDPASHSLKACLDACNRPLAILLLLGSALVLGVLLQDKSQGGHRLSYTLDRLAVSPRGVIVCQAVYNLLAWLLFWAAEALAILAIFRLYENMGGYVGPQTLYLATWQNDLIHAFLPLDEGSRWGLNLSLLFGLSITSACSSAQERQKNRAYASFVLLGIAVVSFFQMEESGWSNLFLSLLILTVTGVALYNALLLGKEVLHEEISTE